MSRDKNAADFTSGSITKKLLQFMIPVLGALVLQAMYGAVDLLVVGRFGNSVGISGVSTGSNVINLVTFVITALTMGVTVLISRYLGARKNERIGKVIGGAICFFVALGLVLMILLLIFAPALANLLQAPKEAFDVTVTYIRICGAGILFVIAYNVISGIFRGIGNSRLPLVFVAIACAVNIIGDMIFVAGLKWNVAGAALATILAQAVSVVLSLFIIKRQELPFTIKKSDIGLNKEIGKFLKLGGPIALQEALTNISFLILCAIVNGMGIEASSGYGIAQKLVAFVMLIPSSLMQSMSAFIGQNVGAGLEKRAQKAMRTGMIIGVCIGAFVTALSFFQGEFLSRAFSENSAYIAKSAEYLKGFCPEAMLTCIVFSYIGYFNGHGKTIPVMIQGISASFLVRVPLSYLFSLKEGATLVDVGVAVPMASVYGIVFFTSWYIAYQKKLKKEEV